MRRNSVDSHKISYIHRLIFVDLEKKIKYFKICIKIEYSKEIV